MRGPLVEGPDARFSVFGDERLGRGRQDVEEELHLPLQHHGAEGRGVARLHVHHHQPVPPTRPLPGEQLHLPQR